MNSGRARKQIFSFYFSFQWFTSILFIRDFSQTCRILHLRNDLKIHHCLCIIIWMYLVNLIFECDLGRAAIFSVWTRFGQNEQKTRISLRLLKLSISEQDRRNFITLPIRTGVKIMKFPNCLFLSVARIMRIRRVTKADLNGVRNQPLPKKSCSKDLLLSIYCA